MAKKVCFECDQQINLSTDKHVLLGTYNGDITENETYFHSYCFYKFYNRKVSEKAKNTTASIQQKVQGLISNPQVAGILDNIGGIDKIKNMLGTDLKDTTDDVKDIMEHFANEEKPKSDENKNGNGKRKSKEEM